MRALAFTFVVVMAPVATADDVFAPSPERIASNTSSGDVSHCAHYRRTTARAPVDVRDAIEVGIHMCENFGTKAHPVLSVEGRRWLASTTHCLMRDMDRAFATEGTHAMTVPGLLSYTADSHVACYVDHGFCELSLDDKRALLAVLDAEAWRATPTLVPASAALVRSSLTMAGACAARALAP